MITFDYRAFGAKVVRSDRLDAFFMNGGSWRIVAMFQEEVVETVHGTSNASNGYQVPTSEQKTFTKTFFLIVQADADAVIEELRNSVANLEAATRGARDKARTLEEDLKKEVDEHTKARQRAADSSTAVAVKDRDLRAATERSRKLEGDLAKVRRALGELRWKEILDDAG